MTLQTGTAPGHRVHAPHTWVLDVELVAGVPSGLEVREPTGEDAAWVHRVANSLAALGVSTTLRVPSGSECLHGGSALDLCNLPLRAPGASREAPPHAVGAWAVLVDGEQRLVVEIALEPATDGDALVELVRSARVAHWLEALGMPGNDGVPEAVYTPGADSALIAKVAVAQGPVVIKVGDRRVVQNEAEFTGRVNALMRGRGYAELFPRQFGATYEGDLGIIAMEPVRPHTLDSEIFADRRMTSIRADAGETLRPYLEALGNLYAASAAARPPSMGTYIYRDRFAEVVRDPGFLRCFERYFPGEDLGEFLGASWTLADGTVLAGIASLGESLRRHCGDLAPTDGSLVHGDVHLKNMLRRADGSPVLIDARTVWDGHRREDEGFGDPAYDLATLLHSLWPMSAVLKAVENRRTEELVEFAKAGRDYVTTTTSVMPEQVAAIERSLVDRIVLFDAGDESVARARLRVGAANALMGWLKYENALPTRHAWVATYIAALRYLFLALAVLDRPLTLAASVPTESKRPHE